MPTNPDRLHLHGDTTGYRWPGPDPLIGPSVEEDGVTHFTQCPDCGANIEPYVTKARRRAIHAAWLAVHIRRFDAEGDRETGRTYDGRPLPGGPDSIYQGVRIAEGELRRLWAETGDQREIGSLSTGEV